MFMVQYVCSLVSQFQWELFVIWTQFQLTSLTMDLYTTESRVKKNGIDSFTIMIDLKSIQKQNRMDSNSFAHDIVLE